MVFRPLAKCRLVLGIGVSDLTHKISFAISTKVPPCTSSHGGVVNISGEYACLRVRLTLRSMEFDNMPTPDAAGNLFQGTLI